MTEWETGRPAYVGNLLDEVVRHRDVAQVVEAMLADLRAHPGDWENATLDRYLDALAALIDSVDSLLVNRGQKPPNRPNWRLVAELLVGATGYE